MRRPAGDTPSEQVLTSILVGEGEEAAIVISADGEVRFGPRLINDDRPQDSERSSRLSVRSESGPWLTYVPYGTLLSGLLVPGSTRVQVTAPVAAAEVAVAGGAYVALLRDHVLQRDAFIVFRDDSDQVVPWPVKDELKREPVTDTDIPCPACGELDWDAVEVRSSERASRYRKRGLVCGTCGNQWGGWTEVGRRRPGTGSLVHSAREDFGDGPGAEARIVSAARVRVYGLPLQLGTDRRVSEWGGEDDGGATYVQVSQRVVVDGRPVEVRVSSALGGDRSEADDGSRAIARLAGDLFSRALDKDEALMTIRLAQVESAGR